MKKTYKMFLACVLCLLGAMNVNAELISLQEVPFCNWDGWGADAKSTGEAACDWKLGESTGQPYGSSTVIPYADLSNFTKLIVTVTEGTPRFLLNRDVDEGKASASEADAHLIDNTVAGWSDKYFSNAPGANEGETVYTVDLKQLVKDKGFAHLHAIKGANWANVTVVSMMVERTAKAPVGWTSIINNGNLESEDVSSFFLAEDAVNVPGTKAVEITDGAGVDGSNGLMIISMAGATETWATQLFVKANEALPEGTKWRFSMDVKADDVATIAVGAHAEPRSWLAGGFMPDFDVPQDWTTITGEGTIDADLGAKGFQSIAFDLNVDKANANVFYFDNIVFEVFKLGTTAEFCSIFAQLDFGFDTNIGALAKATTEKRVFFPKSSVTVKVNGTKLDDEKILSVEGFEDGRFYIFFDDAEVELKSSDVVTISFKNPADAAYHVVYASGSVSGQDVADLDVEATYNADIEVEDAYAYIYKSPVIVAADPEDGSFNLPNSISEFKVTFDKPADCEKIQATLNGENLVAEPATGLSKNITFKRTSAGDLATGEYTMHITKIFPELSFLDDIFGDTVYVFNVGKVETTEEPKEMLPDYFATAGANTIPEGYKVIFGQEERLGGTSQGSGSRMFEFAAGGDFTKGLYYREGYVEYGTSEDPAGEKNYDLELEAGKGYDITFYTCMWKDNGSATRFQIFAKDDLETPLFTKVIANTYNANGNTGAAINGSAFTKIKFTPETTGKYVLRWVSSGSETGDPEYKENILGKPGVKYVPNTAGIEYVQNLAKALEDAKAAIEANADARFNGPDFDALSAAYTKHETAKDGYTAPSVYNAAIEELNALTEAMKNHRTLCDNYDTNVKASIDVQRKNEMPNGDPAQATKFTTTDLFAELVALNAKYHASSKWTNDTTITPNDVDPAVNDTVIGDAYLVYTYDVLKNNDSLTVAVKELKEMATTTSLLFTEGESTCSSTGVKVAMERIRLGIEGLKALGVAKDDPMLVEANKALGDDDVIVEALKARVKTILFDSLRNANNHMFDEVVDTTTLESSTPTYDVTVFVKNPNIYKLSDKTDFTDEAVPGWVVPEGFSRPGLSCGWGAFQGTSIIAEDCMFQTWGGSYRVEQTITDLPAGVYSIQIGFGERVGDEGSNIDQSFVYAKTTETPAVEDGLDEDRTLNFAGTADCPNIGQSFPKANTLIENVEVVDGVLTIGANAAQGSHTFFNDVRLLIAAPAKDFNYENAYKEVVDGVETVSAATVRNIEVYDLNGRRMIAAPRGVSIVKKYMSDGTVRVQKVVVK